MPIFFLFFYASKRANKIKIEGQVEKSQFCLFSRGLTILFFIKCFLFCPIASELYKSRPYADAWVQTHYGLHYLRRMK
jgi:hypothetical protein